MPHPWRHSRPGWMWLWAAWSAGWRPAHSSGLELDERCGPLQPRPFYDSMISAYLVCTHTCTHSSVSECRSHDTANMQTVGNVRRKDALLRSFILLSLVKALGHSCSPILRCGSLQDSWFGRCGVNPEPQSEGRCSCALEMEDVPGAKKRHRQHRGGVPGPGGDTQSSAHCPGTCSTAEGLRVQHCSAAH